MNRSTGAPTGIRGHTQMTARGPRCSTLQCAVGEGLILSATVGSFVSVVMSGSLLISEDVGVRRRRNVVDHQRVGLRRRQSARLASFEHGDQARAGTDFDFLG